MLPLSLDPACSWHWILTALLVDSFEARDLTHSSLLTMFFWCRRCLLKPMSFQPLSVDVSFSWHPYLLASLFLRPSSLDTRFSLGTIFLVSFCFHAFLLGPLSVKIALLWDLLSWHLLCLEVVFHSHVFLLASLSFSVFVHCKQSSSCAKQLRSTSYDKAFTKYFPVLLRTTKLAQSTPSSTSYCKACTKYLAVLLRTTKLAQSTSQYYFVPQSLHRILPSTTSYHKACTEYFPVLIRTTKLAKKYLPALLGTAKLAEILFTSLLS